MGKYEPLARYLESLDSDSWDAGFSDVEKVLGFHLPQSAHEYPAWWANQDGAHSQTKGWREAGWETSKVDLSGKRIRFVRARASSRNTTVSAEDEVARLWRKAKEISGISNRPDLEKAVLTTFIQREAAKKLIAMGGSDPNACAAPRERPFG